VDTVTHPKTTFFFNKITLSIVLQRKSGLKLDFLNIC
jgi:hypothetical protein